MRSPVPGIRRVRRSPVAQLRPYSGVRSPRLDPIRDHQGAGCTLTARVARTSNRIVPWYTSSNGTPMTPPGLH
jgi:hypothetical protein